MYSKIYESEVKYANLSLKVYFKKYGGLI